jgi:hypothetical protein
MSVVAAIGGALSLVGQFISTSASLTAAEETRQASTKAENTREQQMQLEGQRRRRGAVREALMARSMSLSAGVSQGAQYGTSVASGMGGAMSAGKENLQTVNSSEILGSRMFGYNRDYANAAARGQVGAAIGAGISSLGGAIINNAGSIQQLGTNFFGTRPRASTPVSLPQSRGFGFGYAGRGD